MAPRESHSGLYPAPHLPPALPVLVRTCTGAVNPNSRDRHGDPGHALRDAPGGANSNASVDSRRAAELACAAVPENSTPYCEHATVVSDGVPMQLDVARPTGSAWCAVIVVQEALGATPFLHDVVVRLAEDGVLAVAPDFYHRLDADRRAFTEAQAQDSMVARAEGMTDTMALADIAATLDWIERDSPGLPIACCGFCWGGRVSVLAAVREPARVAAAVSFYGGGMVGPARVAADAVVVEELPHLRAPVLLHYGEEDAYIPAQHRDAVRDALQRAGADFEMHVYPAAGHGFMRHTSQEHRPAAAADAWPRMLAWLRAKV